MNEIELLQELGARAEHRNVPTVDVTDGVMEAIRNQRQSAASSLILVAAAGWTLAILITLFAQQALAAFHDPLGALVGF